MSEISVYITAFMYIILGLEALFTPLAKEEIIHRGVWIVILQTLMVITSLIYHRATDYMRENNLHTLKKVTFRRITIPERTAITLPLKKGNKDMGMYDISKEKDADIVDMLTKIYAMLGVTDDKLDKYGREDIHFGVIERVNKGYRTEDAIKECLKAYSIEFDNDLFIEFTQGEQA